MFQTRSFWFVLTMFHCRNLCFEGMGSRWRSFGSDCRIAGRFAWQGLVVSIACCCCELWNCGSPSGLLFVREILQSQVLRDAVSTSMQHTMLCHSDLSCPRKHPNSCMDCLQIWVIARVCEISYCHAVDLFFSHCLRWLAWKDYFNNSGKLKHIKSLKHCSLDSLLQWAEVGSKLHMSITFVSTIYLDLMFEASFGNAIMVVISFPSLMFTFIQTEWWNK